MNSPKFTAIILSKDKRIGAIECQMPISFDRDGQPLAYAEFTAPVIVLKTEDAGQFYRHTVRISTLWVPRIVPPS